jgi:hypothetical protein
MITVAVFLAEDLSCSAWLSKTRQGGESARPWIDDMTFEKGTDGEICMYLGNVGGVIRACLDAQLALVSVTYTHISHAAPRVYLAPC